MLLNLRIYWPVITVFFDNFIDFLIPYNIIIVYYITFTLLTHLNKGRILYEYKSSYIKLYGRISLNSGMQKSKKFLIFSM
jgi:hypothetical protein